jgi:WD40 repeat protein
MRPEQIFQGLTRLEDLERSAREGTLHVLLPKLESVASALGADPHAAALRALRRALRIDLAFLVEHPEELFSCLYNRLAWHEVPEARSFYALPEARAAAAPFVRPGIDPLRDMLGAWRASREKSGAPWLRSLRPPESGLDGALVEEYRALVATTQRLWLSQSAVEIEAFVRNGDASGEAGARPGTMVVAWERTTGRRLEDLPASDRPEDDIPSDSNALRFPREEWRLADFLDAVSARVIGSRPLRRTRKVLAVAHASHAGLVAFAGRDVAGSGFVVVYNTQTNAVVLDCSVEACVDRVALSPDGERVAASGWHALQVWEVGSGRQTHALPLSRAEVAFSADARLLLTAEVGVVRVWNLGREAIWLRGHRQEEPHYPMFSADGERLVTGSFLCAARTGALIARLDFGDRHYYYDPRNKALMLGTQRVVYLRSRVEAWNAENGVKLVSHESPLYGRSDVMAVSSDGLRYAHARHYVPFRHFDWVRVYDVESGATLCTLKVWGVTSMAWAPDGQTLATGSAKGEVALWDTTSGCMLRTLAGHQSLVFDLAFLRDGECLVSGAENDAVCAWHIRTGELLFSRRLGEGDPSGRWFSGASAKEPDYAWIATPDALDEVRRALGDAAHIKWRVEARDGSLVVVDLSGTPVARFPAIESVEQHPSEPIWAGGAVHFRLEGGAAL